MQCYVEKCYEIFRRQKIKASFSITCEREIFSLEKECQAVVAVKL